MASSSVPRRRTASRGRSTASASSSMSSSSSDGPSLIRLASDARLYRDHQQRYRAPEEEEHAPPPITPTLLCPLCRTNTLDAATPPGACPGPGREAGGDRMGGPFWTPSSPSSLSITIPPASPVSCAPVTLPCSCFVCPGCLGRLVRLSERHHLPDLDTSRPPPVSPPSGPASLPPSGLISLPPQPSGPGSLPPPRPDLDTTASTTCSSQTGRDADTLADVEGEADSVVSEKAPGPFTPPAHLPLQNATEHKARLTHYVSPGKFFVQLEADLPHLVLLEARLQQHGNSKDVPTLQESGVSPRVEDTLVAKYSLNGQWYRCQVLSVPDKDKEKDKVEVFYLDYGNTERVARKDLKAMKAFLAGPSVFALECALAGARPKKRTKGEESGWGEESRKVFLNLFESGSFHLTPFGKKKRGYQVNIFLKAGPHLLKEDEPTRALDVLDFLGLTDTTGRADAADAALSSLSPLLERELRRCEPARTHETHRVLVSHAESPSSFYVQFLAEGAVDWTGERTTPFQQEINMFYQEEKHLRCLKAGPLAVGMVVAAVYPQDKRFYRARVTKIHPDNHQLIGVHYVDYGNSADVAWSQIYKLPEKFLQLPELALHCSLWLNYVPDQWPESVSARFSRQTSGVVLQLRVADGQQCVRNHQQVVLYADEAESVSINAGLAAELAKAGGGKAPAEAGPGRRGAFRRNPVVGGSRGQGSGTSARDAGCGRAETGSGAQWVARTSARQQQPSQPQLNSKPQLQQQQQQSTPTMHQQQSTPRKQQQQQSQSIPRIQQQSQPTPQIQQQQQQQRAFPSMSASTSSRCECTVTHVVSPGEIYLRRKDLDDAWLTFQARLAGQMARAHKSTNKKSSPLKASLDPACWEPRAGHSVCVSDGAASSSTRLRRGQVLGPAEEGKDAYHVRLIDTGHRVQVGKDQMTLMPDRLRRYNAFAVCASLAGVRPAGTSNGRWSQTAIKELEKVVLVKHSVQVVAKGVLPADPSISSPAKMLVDLFLETSVCEDAFALATLQSLDVAAHLVEQGVALRIKGGQKRDAPADNKVSADPFALWSTLSNEGDVLEEEEEAEEDSTSEEEEKEEQKPVRILRRPMPLANKAGRAVGPDSSSSSSAVTVVWAPTYDMLDASRVREATSSSPSSSTSTNSSTSAKVSASAKSSASAGEAPTTILWPAPVLPLTNDLPDALVTYIDTEAQLYVQTAEAARAAQQLEMELRRLSEDAAGAPLPASAADRDVATYRPGDILVAKYPSLAVDGWYRAVVVEGDDDDDDDASLAVLFVDYGEEKLVRPRDGRCHRRIPRHVLLKPILALRCKLDNVVATGEGGCYSLDFLDAAHARIVEKRAWVKITRTVGRFPLPVVLNMLLDLDGGPCQVNLAKLFVEEGACRQISSRQEWSDPEAVKRQDKAGHWIQFHGATTASSSSSPVATSSAESENVTNSTGDDETT